MNKLYISLKSSFKGGMSLKAIIKNNQLTCIGKITDIIYFLTEIQAQYNTVKEYIDDKLKILKK